MTVTEAKIDELEGQLDNATVTLDDNEPRLYSVLVPGAIREQNYVKADDENEALEKVKAVLLQKIEQVPETSTGHVTISPDSAGRRSK